MRDVLNGFLFIALEEFLRTPIQKAIGNAETIGFQVLKEKDERIEIMYRNEEEGTVSDRKVPVGVRVRKKMEAVTERRTEKGNWYNRGLV